MVDKITSDRDVWVDTMMKEELELAENDKSPLSIGIMTFFSFVVVGFIPLMVYITEYLFNPGFSYHFAIASVLTGLAFILIGALKSYFTESSIQKGVLETLGLGTIAALCAYFVGSILEHWLL